ncbi:hypothetical protein DFH06DRAFT_1325701 [Mycena polygramma]|nr:hypothetical protein DFH06DRAFT_1325701 [Mycena polygramma]
MSVWTTYVVVFFASYPWMVASSDAAILKSDVADAYITTLPCELVTWVLLLACGDLFHPVEGRRFPRTRRYISHTCSLWRQIVHGCSSFWSQCYFRPYDAKATVDLNVSRFRDAPLHLRMRFEDYFLFRCHSTIPRPAMMSPRETLDAIIPHLPNCKSLVMLVEDQNAFPTLMKALSHIKGLLLETFVLTRIAVVEHLTKKSTPFVGTLFSAQLPKLRNLYLTRATIGWSRPCSFVAIDTLVLCDLRPPYSPTKSQFGAVVEAASVLRRISFRNLTITASHEDDPLLTFVSLSVVEIDVHFDGDRSLSSFVNCLSLPALRTVSVQINSMEDISCVVQCAELLRTAINFTVLSRSIFTEYLFRYPWERVELCYMLEKLHSVQRLDLVRAGPHFFPSMLMGDKKLCPALKSLALTQAVVRHLKKFLLARVGVDSLPSLSLELHDLNRLDGDESDLGAVKALAGPGYLVFDPDYEDLLGWLTFQY